MTSPDLLFLHHATYPLCEARVDERFADFHCVQLMSAGAVDLWYDDRHHLMQGGWFWPTSPGPRVRFWSHDGRPWVHRYIAFSGPLADAWLREGLLPTGPSRVADAVGMANRLDEVCAHIRGAGPWDHRIAVNLLERWLLDIVQPPAEPGEDPPWLAHVRSRVRDTALGRPDYDALAAEVGMGGRTLQRRFRETTGLSLHRAHVQARVDEVRRMLAETDLPPKEIARRLGYQDVYYFSRQFRQVVGASPGTYRRTRLVGRSSRAGRG